MPSWHFASFQKSLFILLILSSPAFGYESDQYTNRTQKVSDSIVLMNGEVNDAIGRILGRGRPPTSKKTMARAIYHEIGGIYWADKIERWAAKSPDVEKYHQTRHKSIYAGMPIWATRVNFVFGVGRSFRVNDVMVGSDKFGHFVSQGYKYFKRDLRGESSSLILAKGRFAERWIFGLFTTGVYSNADLVANYEGWLFYKSLFDDDVITGKKSILILESGRYRQLRPFDWADHINDYWDEALNPSFNVKSLNKRLRQSIKKLCPQYHARPDYFDVPNDEDFWQRYQHIGLRDNRRNQFVLMCLQ
jgi:hypothetical protein